MCGSGSRTDAINFLWCRLGQAAPSLAHSPTAQAGHSEWASKTEREKERWRWGKRRRQAGSARQTAAWPSALQSQCAVCSGQQTETEAEGESFNRTQQTCNFIRMSVEMARDRVKSSVKHWKKGRRRRRWRSRGGAAARRGQAGRGRVRTLSGAWSCNENEIASTVCSVCSVCIAAREAMGMGRGWGTTTVGLGLRLRLLPL